MLSLPESVHALAVHATFPHIASENRLELECTKFTTRASTLALRTCAREPGVDILSLENFSMYRSTCAAEESFSQALAAAVKSKPSIVTFSGVLISPDRLESILGALAQNPNIRHLEAVYFRTFRSGRSSSSSGESIGIHQILATGLSRLQSLQSLSLQDVSFVHRTDKFVPEALRTLTDLTELRLDSCITAAHMHASYLRFLQQLQTLEITFSANSEDDATELAACLSSLTLLTSLVLSGRMVSLDLQDYSFVLASACQPLKGLRHLHLRGSGIREAGTVALSGAVRGMRQLESFTAGLFRIGEEALTMLDSLAFSKCTQLVLQSEVNIRAVQGRFFCEKIAALNSLAHLHVPRFALSLCRRTHEIILNQLTAC